MIYHFHGCSAKQGMLSPYTKGFEACNQAAAYQKATTTHTESLGFYKGLLLFQGLILYREELVKNNGGVCEMDAVLIYNIYGIYLLSTYICVCTLKLMFLNFNFCDWQSRVLSSSLSNCRTFIPILPKQYIAHQQSLLILLPASLRQLLMYFLSLQIWL